jgi:hypothetical protein
MKGGEHKDTKTILDWIHGDFISESAIKGRDEK